MRNLSRLDTLREFVNRRVIRRVILFRKRLSAPMHRVQSCVIITAIRGGRNDAITSMVRRGELRRSVVCLQLDRAFGRVDSKNRERAYCVASNFTRPPALGDGAIRHPDRPARLRAAGSEPGPRRLPEFRRG